MSRDDSAARTREHHDAAYWGRKPVSLDDPPPRGGRGVWIAFCVAAVAIVAWGMLI